MKFASYSTALITLLITISCSSNKKPKEYDVMRTTMQDTAKVTKVDYDNKKITLATNDGPVVLNGEDIRNLNSIKKGDTVIAEYKSALVYSIDKSGKKQDTDLSMDAWRGKPGEQPAAGSTMEVITSAVITDIDYDEPSVTLENEEGEKQDFPVKHPERLQGVKVGDVVNIKYSEALALRVEKKDSASY